MKQRLSAMEVCKDDAQIVAPDFDQRMANAENVTAEVEHELLVNVSASCSCCSRRCFCCMWHHYSCIWCWWRSRDCFELPN